ncbi:hypothetical protein GOP47_0017731 [Adiantum capillus-veneris]|uniref:Elongator complex protein 4 n=1 Tax=Adiantum capillus-veneris TaxID=13818 RepID=A0A9D4UGT0_ADICA|nr:hypothetical protein GOP47_0017731 [Adiantum capillus-veneris]
MQEEVEVDEELLLILDDALEDFVHNMDNVHVSNVDEVVEAQDVHYQHALTSHIRGDLPWAFIHVLFCLEVFNEHAYTITMALRGSSSFTRRGSIPGALPSPFIRLDSRWRYSRRKLGDGLVHGQPLLFGCPLPSPESFLGTLPGLSKPKEGLDDSTSGKSSEVGGLRIAWQYRKFINEQQSLEDRRLQQQKLLNQSLGVKQEYCDSFDVRKQVERALLTSGHVECVNFQSEMTLTQLQERCQNFCTRLLRPQQQMGRIVLQSLCAPQGLFFDKDWELLNFLHALKGLLRTSNTIAFITFPPALLTPSFSVRWQHMADILLSIEAIADDDKNMAAMITDYNDIIGFVRVLKLPCINTQVPSVPESSVYALKFVRRRTLSLERLNQAPVDASAGESSDRSASSLLCGGPAKAASPLDF